MRIKITLNIGLNTRNGKTNNAGDIIDELGNSPCFLGLVAYDETQGEWDGEPESTVVAVVIAEDKYREGWQEYIRTLCDRWNQESIAWAIVDHKGRIAEGGLEFASDVTPYLSFHDDYFTTHYRGFAS